MELFNDIMTKINSIVWSNALREIIHTRITRRDCQPFSRRTPAKAHTL